MTSRARSCLLITFIFLNAIGFGCGPRPTSHSDTLAHPHISANNNVVVTTAANSKGEFLTDDQGLSLYVFQADTPGHSYCNNMCSQAWPPLILPHGDVAVASGDAQQNSLGTISRSDGSVQITYKGMPLYYCSGDSASGQTAGENLHQFGNYWSLIQPSGYLL